MIYYLTGELFEGAVSAAALENLVVSGRTGNHVILGDRATLSRAAGYADLGALARSFFRERTQSMTQLASLTKDYSYIEVDVSDPSTEFQGNGTVPLGVFSNSDYCEKGQLITENLDDAVVLKGIAEIKLGRRRGLRLQLRLLNGGGSTTARVIRQTTDAPSGPTVCVVDSDRKYNGSALGQTALAAKQADAAVLEKWRFHLSTLEYRELENLIPRDIREAAILSLAPEMLPSAERVASLMPQVSSFCCLKNGDSVCKMIEAARARGHFAAQESLELARKEMQSLGNRCTECPHGGCTNTPRLGPRFLSHVATFFSRGAAQSAVDSWQPHLSDIAMHVISVGIAQMPFRAL